MSNSMRLRSKISLNENWLDKIVRFAAPVKALDRFKARMTLALAGSYAGGSRQKRSLAHYLPSDGDADSDVLTDLPLLRQRSRDLLRNNPLALGAMNTVCTNVVGTGLKLQARIDRDFLQLSDEEADALESNIEREFRLWANSTHCDVVQTLNFAGLQELVFRSTLENGDCFILLSYQQNYSLQHYRLALQVIEADRICNKEHASDNETLMAGVQKNRVGAPVAYHLLKTHPGNLYGALTREWFVLPAFNVQTGFRQVIHLYRMLRPGQTRGVPYLAPVIEALKQLGSYTEAEIMAAVISSYFTVFIKSPQGESQLLPMAKSERHAADNDYQLGNGAIVDLAEGEDISTVNPGRPNAQFDPFVQSILRQIGVALELPFEVLVKHFTASYSAARAALLEAWRFFMARREWLAQNFCQVVYETWLMEAVCCGRIQAPGFIDGDPAIRAAYCGSHWIGPAPGQIDPLKEIQAARERIDAGISTLSRETAALTGEEWEKTHRQGVKERRMRGESEVADSGKATTVKNEGKFS
jgi:lambda family phage portal protein